MPGDSLPVRLEHALAAAPAGPLTVAFSGGPDSSALLHALSRLPAARDRNLSAMHVDHRLHAHSSQWAEQVQAFCQQLEVPVTVLPVHVERASGQGPEAAARKARYQAFSQHLAAGTLLAFAHHREDQAETVLLKLLRGAGPEGLGGMRDLRPYAHIQLWRPLLDCPREILQRYVQQHALITISDPANQQPNLARSYLRTTVLPSLTRHWPEVHAALAHSARLSRTAAHFIDRHARNALTLLQGVDPYTLHAAPWRALDDALRGLVLEHWLHAQELPAPSTAQRNNLERQVAEAAADRIPRIAWKGAELRIWRGWIYAMPPQSEPRSEWTLPWTGEQIALPGGGTLALLPEQAVPVPLRVRSPRPGETMLLQGHPHHTALNKLFQQAGIPPWLRHRCPMIEDWQGHLLAVADLALTTAGLQRFDELQTRPRWDR